MDVFTEMLHSWQSFYFMAGGAALIGLMFVALSFGMNVVSNATIEDVRTFVSPSIAYFVSVLLLACVMLVPVYAPPGLAIILFCGGVVGLARTFRPVRRLIETARRHQDFDKEDWLAQVILPVVNYALIVMAALCFAADQWSPGFTLTWLVTILLLLSAIANTWSLVLWILEQRGK
jgi:hypothetical protein